MKRKGICIFIIMLLALSIIPSTVFAASENNQVLWQVSNKDVGIIDQPEMKSEGPESFFVQNKNQIYICDTVNSQIVYFENGIMTKYCQLEEQTINVPNKKFQISNTNDVYQMAQNSNTVNIVKLSPKTNVNELPSYLSNAKTLVTQESSIVPMSVGGSTARQNAIDCFLYIWTYIPSQNGVNPPTGVIQPHFLRGVTSNLSVTGIPYCRGGSQGTNFTRQSSIGTFPQAIYNNTYAGNINSGNYIGGAGMDCSGYATVAYRLDKKYATYTLVGTGTEPFKYVTDGTKQSMDILNYSNHHVVIHADTIMEGSTVYYLIYEETTTDFEGRTKDKTVGYATLPSNIPTTYKRARLK